MKIWFKNLQIFKFIESFNMNAEELEEQLSKNLFQPCSSVEHIKGGFVSPNDQNKLVYQDNGMFLLCLQVEKKIIPTAVLKQELNKKVKEIEMAQHRTVRKREKETLRDDIYHNLVMRAFSKIERTYAYIDLREGLLVVDTASHSKAEEFTVVLRRTLGSLKIEIPKTLPLVHCMTQWAKGNNLPHQFHISDRSLILSNDEGKIRCEKQNIFSDEIQTLVHDCRSIIQLSLLWDDRLGFTLTQDLTIKSVKYLESLQDNIPDSAQQSFDADFYIMSSTLRGFIKDLLNAVCEESQGVYIDPSQITLITKE